jgi:hypothetical protein
MSSFRNFSEAPNAVYLNYHELEDVLNSVLMACYSYFITLKLLNYGLTNERPFYAPQRPARVLTSYAMSTGGFIPH